MCGQGESVGVQAGIYDVDSAFIGRGSLEEGEHEVDGVNISRKNPPKGLRGPYMEDSQDVQGSHFAGACVTLQKDPHGWKHGRENKQRKKPLKGKHLWRSIQEGAEVF
ncbi:MAG: hypothetical protein Q4C96_01250 [Planctomycetia bacterium]|nr:hypothetical protein [Planctomycetia bacterium]